RGRVGPGRGAGRGQGGVQRRPRPVPARARGCAGRRRPQPAPGTGGAARRPRGGGRRMSADVFAAMEAARRGGRTVVMGTTVRTEGGPPWAPGDRALFAPAGGRV